MDALTRMRESRDRLEAEVHRCHMIIYGKANMTPQELNDESKRDLPYTVSGIVLCIALIALSFFFFVCGTANAQSKWYTTYYSTWMMLPVGSAGYACPPWEMEMTGLTHIILFDNGNVTKTSPYWAYMFAGAGYPASGNIQAGRPADTESDSLSIHYNCVASPGDGVNRTQYLDSLVTIAHRNGVKVCITIQAVATTTPCLNYVAIDSARTQLFVNTLVAWAERKHLDGVELDWEGWAGTPLPGVDTISQFVRILHRRVHDMTTGLGTPGEIIISAGSSYQAKYDPAQDYMVDQFDLQLYDYAYAWYGSPVNSNSAWFLSPLYQGYRPTNFQGESYETRGPIQWVAYGHDPAKIGLGIPAYSYMLRNVDSLFEPITSGGDMGEAKYQTVEALKSNGGTEVWDDVRKVRYIYGTAIDTAGAVYYGSEGVNAGQKFLAVGETPRSVREKISWMKSQGYGGIMTYDYAKDFNSAYPKGDSLRNPIQYTVRTELSGYTAPTTQRHYLRKRK